MTPLDQYRAEIFRTCCRLIESGQATIEQCAARYPNFPELQGLLEVVQATRQLRQTHMNSDRKAALQRQLIARMNVTARPRQRRVVPRYAALLAAACIVFFLVVGIGAVEASAKALPGDFLYGIKRASENVQLALAPAQTKPTVLFDIAQARLEELTALAGRAKPIDTTFFNDVVSAVQEAANAPLDPRQREVLFGKAQLALQTVTAAKEATQEAPQLGTALASVGTPTE